MTRSRPRPRPRAARPALEGGARARTPLLERAANHATLALVAATGAGLGVLKYLVPPDPEAFSVVGHPWQPAFLDAHVLAAPLMLLAVGMLLRGHVLRRLRLRTFRESRRSGLAVVVLLGPLVASGYLLQVVTSEAIRGVLVVTHVVTGTLYATVHLAHLWAARRATLPDLRAHASIRA